MLMAILCILIGGWMSAMSVAPSLNAWPTDAIAVSR